MQRFFSFKSNPLEQGRFTGRAAVYGSEIAFGAFTKSIAESKGIVKIVPAAGSVSVIGLGQVTDGPSGLDVTARLELGLQEARDAYVRLQKGLTDGVCVDFQATKHRGGVITEANIWSIALCTWAGTAGERITDVKRGGDAAALRSLLTALRGANIAARDRQDSTDLKDLLLNVRLTKYKLSLDSLLRQLL